MWMWRLGMFLSCVLVCVKACLPLDDEWKRPLGLGESVASDLGVNPSDSIPVSPCVNPCVSDGESGWSGNRFSSATVISVLLRNRREREKKKKHDEDSAMSDAEPQADSSIWWYADCAYILVHRVCGHSYLSTTVRKICRCLHFRFTLLFLSLVGAFCLNCARELLHPSPAAVALTGCHHQKIETIFSVQSLIHPHDKLFNMLAWFQKQSWHETMDPSNEQEDAWLFFSGILHSISTCC